MARNSYEYEVIRGVAIYMIENGSTLRKLEAKFNIPKSTIHKQFLTRFKEDDYVTFAKVAALLEKNKIERAARGGEATRQKFIKMLFQEKTEENSNT
jgi:hypothetical protein